MGTKHTPGPWVASGGGGVLPNEGRWDVSSPDGVVAILAGPRAGYDARLIAGAPELLRTCLLAFESLPHEAGCRPTPCKCRVSELASAIAKVTQP